MEDIGAEGGCVPEVDDSDIYGIISSTTAEIGTHVWNVDHLTFSLALSAGLTMNCDQVKLCKIVDDVPYVPFRFPLVSACGHGLRHLQLLRFRRHLSGFKRSGCLGIRSIQNFR